MEKTMTNGHVNGNGTVLNGVVVNGTVPNGIKESGSDKDVGDVDRRAEGVASLKQKLINVVDMIKAAQSRFEVSYTQFLHATPFFPAVSLRFLKNHEQLG